MKSIVEKNYIYETAVNPPVSGEEFSLELFHYSPDLSCSGTPCKKINTFDELLQMIDEFEEETKH
ncbi:hypothetical protein PY093_15060 [Cytobacillus sp. S13-E01]|uniref:hypothetical protein n=1 Tax=Cytobacillus sp. S13-E01 TaxID=3031326 RepID=UPI0023D80980|nr:hypothetical protein [Cytobacillus sp. S13-E01]MDF0727991.1 hypothetical protein [Cytobacillus sp. S13-E01]